MKLVQTRLDLFKPVQTSTSLSISLSLSGWPQTHRDPPNSTSHVLCLKACVTTAWLSVARYLSVSFSQVLGLKACITTTWFLIVLNKNKLKSVIWSEKWRIREAQWPTTRETFYLYQGSDQRVYPVLRLLPQMSNVYWILRMSKALLLVVHCRGLERKAVL